MLQVCDSISPALAIEAAWELGKVHARLGHVDEAVRHFKRDSVHGTEQSIRVLLAHGAGAAALALASSLPSPSKEIYTAVAQYVSDGSVTLPATAADTIIGPSGVADAVYKANYAALAAASDLVIKADTAGLPESSQTKNLDQAVTLWNELVDAFSTQDEDANTTTPADLSFQATVLANLGPSIKQRPDPS
ncbi:hypothetical protein AaE_004896 [Aphanomyces astaci]|uniref:Uncharacterized protein n=1 Tax=Aphanomyces astaci TaxID=112090 RepID=A0A6A5AMP1_APHAT|nr:hypothetical protein AaE_004896 [Aphanomyces astaci]